MAGPFFIKVIYSEPPLKTHVYRRKKRSSRRYIERRFFWPKTGHFFWNNQTDFFQTYILIIPTTKYTFPNSQGGGLGGVGGVVGYIPLYNHDSYSIVSGNSFFRPNGSSNLESNTFFGSPVKFRVFSSPFGRWIGKLGGGGGRGPSLCLLICLPLGPLFPSRFIFYNTALSRIFSLLIRLRSRTFSLRLYNGHEVPQEGRQEVQALWYVVPLYCFSFIYIKST